MRFLSICSGIEAASVAFHPLGWQALAFAEIEPFPCSLLAHHYPQVPNLGDLTRWREWSPQLLALVEVLCGGTPCQAFSVAGLRGSLSDERGNLTLTFCHLFDEIDRQRHLHGRSPAVCLWENVPGVLNTPDNAFGHFLAGLAGEDVPLTPPGSRWTDAGYVRGPRRAVAWRVLDAQYFGLAQRRERVFVVASADPAFDPAAVLFELDGLRRDTPPRRGPGEGAASSPSPNASMTFKPAQPMPKPDLTASFWMQFFRAAQKLGLHAPGVRLALALLAHPDGLVSEQLFDRPKDIHRLSCYARRPVPWVRIELVRYESNGTRRVRYHATPHLHAALAMPPVYARRMHRRLEGWLAACDAGHVTDMLPLRLFVMLVLVAAHPTAEAGFPASRNEFRTVPFLVQSLAYSAYWDRLTALGMLRCQPGKTPHYWITDAGRRALGLPSPAPATAPLRTAQPYTNRNAA